MLRIAPMLPRAVFDIGVVSDRVFKSRLYREYDFGNARRKVPSLRGTPCLHRDRLPLRRPPHLHRPGGGVVTAGIVHGMDAVDVGPYARVDVADHGAVVPAIPGTRYGYVPRGSILCGGSRSLCNRDRARWHPE